MTEDFRAINNVSLSGATEECCTAPLSLRVHNHLQKVDVDSIAN